MVPNIPELTVTIKICKKLNLKSNMALGTPTFAKKKIQEINTENIFRKSVITYTGKLPFKFVISLKNSTKTVN